jgi:hypothetical protein
MRGLLLECSTSTPVSPDFGLERDILFKVEGLVDKHGKRLVFKEKVFFFGVKNTAGIWVLAGSEVTGFDSAPAAACQEDLGKWGREIVLDEWDGDSGGAVKRCDIAVVGVRDPTRAGVDTDEGSVVRGCATSFDEVIDEVIDSHNDGRVVDFSDRGRAAADMGDLLNELFSSALEVMADGFRDWLRVKWWDWEDWGGGVDHVDFVAVATDKGVLF